jgi:small subunit ribosomal protein S20
LPNTRSAIRQLKKSLKRRMRNRAVKSAIKTRVKKTLAVASTDPDKAISYLRQAISEIDRAVKKGVIHRNNAARRKSRLMAKLNKLLASQAAA